VILCEGGVIGIEHLPLGIISAVNPTPMGAVPTEKTKSAPSAAAGSGTSQPPPGARTLEATEREMILQALARAGNNKSKAARLLGLTRAQLRSRIDKHGLFLEDTSES